jgi:hypothetical protein
MIARKGSAFQREVLSRMIVVALWIFSPRMWSDCAQAAESGAAEPPIGAVLNPQHPLGAGLVVCPLLNEGKGQSLWDSGTQQSFIMDNPLIWVSLPQTLQYPWAGPALRFNEAPGTGPGCRIDVSHVPFFQSEPNGSNGFTIAYLWSPNTGVAKSARRIGDTDKTSCFTIYESIAGHPNQWTYTYRNAGASSTNVVLLNFPYTPGSWIFSVVCVKEGEIKVYQDGVLLSTRTDLNFHNTWGQGNTAPPIWWHMTEGPFFNGTNNVGFGGDLGGAWIWDRYLSQEDVTSLYNEPWGMFSLPSILGHVRADQPGSVTLSWQSVTGLLYSIQWTTNLLEGFTGLVQSNILATPPTNTIAVPLTNERCFYRLAF